MTNPKENYTEYLDIVRLGGSSTTDRWELITRAIEYIQWLEHEVDVLNATCDVQSEELTQYGLRIMELERWIE